MHLLFYVRFSFVFLQQIQKTYEEERTEYHNKQRDAEQLLDKVIN